MSIEEDFYASIKLKTGEEIFAKIAVSEETDKTMILVFNPVVVSEIKSRSGEIMYKLESWMKTTTEDLFVINMDNILTMSESYDIEMIYMHQSYVNEVFKKKNYNSNSKSKLNRQMGYIASVNDAKQILEKLYKNS
jgi:hypothetical protein